MCRSCRYLLLLLQSRISQVIKVTLPAAQLLLLLSTIYTLQLLNKSMENFLFCLMFIWSHHYCNYLDTTLQHITGIFSNLFIGLNLLMSMSITQ